MPVDSKAAVRIPQRFNQSGVKAWKVHTGRGSRFAGTAPTCCFGSDINACRIWVKNGQTLQI
jgi:hypothetical protein